MVSLNNHPITMNIADEEIFYQELLQKPEPPDYTSKVFDHGFTVDELEAFEKSVTDTLRSQDYDKMRDCDQHSDLWFASRKHRMTGSIISGVIGVNPYSNYHETCKNLVEPSFQGNECTRWGNDHEDHAVDIYTEYMKKVTVDDNFTVQHRGICVHPDVPYFGASPDGVIPNLGLLQETKCPYMKRNNPPGEHPYRKYHSNIPPYYYSQMQFLMECLNLEKAHFWVWIPSSSYITTLTRDERYIQKMKERADQFFKKVYIPALFLHERGLPYQEVKKRKLGSLDDDGPEPDDQNDGFQFPFL